jgi:hypothetical protein
MYLRDFIIIVLTLNILKLLADTYVACVFDVLLKREVFRSENRLDVPGTLISLFGI